MVTKMFTELQVRMEEYRSSTVTINTRKYQTNYRTKKKNALTELKNTIKGLKSKSDNTEEQSSDLEDRVVNHQSEQQEE